MPHSVRNDLGDATPKRNAPGLRRRTSRRVSLLPTWTDIRILNMNRGLVNLQKDEKRTIASSAESSGLEAPNTATLRDECTTGVQWPLARP